MAARYPDQERVGASDPSTDGATTHLETTFEHHATFAEASASTPVTPALTAPRDVGVCVLSLDPQLIETIRRSGGGRYAFFIAPTWSDLIARIQAAECGVAVLDTAALEDRIAKRIAELEDYADRLATLVAADRHEAEELVGYLSSRKIHRLLIKPAAAGITRLLLESAVARYFLLLGRPDAQLDETGTHFLPIASSRRPLFGRWLIGASLLVAASIVALAWTFWPVFPTARSSADTRVRSASPPAPIEAPTDRFARLIANAESAFAEGRLSEPTGDNALDYYLTIVAADPTHTQAQERLAVVVEALFTQAESALLDDSLDPAAAILANVRRADPESPRLAFLEAQLARARKDTTTTAGAAAAELGPELAAAEVASAEIAATPVATKVAAAAVVAEDTAAARAAPTELESLLAIAQARIARKQWLEPAGDGAVHYLERASQLGAADPRVRAASTELATGLATAARTALRDDDVDTAGRLLDQARRFSAGGTAAKAVADVTAARNEALLARARERIQSGALIAPEADSALRYLTTLDDGSAERPDVAAAWRDFSTALVAQVQTALGARNWAAADSGISALEVWGRDSANAAALRRRLVVERTQEKYLAAASPMSELALLSQTLPEYPLDAQRLRIEGWVDVEFVADKMGNPRGVTVVEGSESSRRFERAAVDAVSQYRFEPFELDGQSYERRVRLRVNFKLR